VALVINTNLLPILHRCRNSIRYVHNRYIWLPLLRLTPPMVPRWRFFCIILRRVFSASRVLLAENGAR